VVWTRQHLIKVNVGPKKANQDGHQQTVFQRFYRQLAQKSKTLPSLSIRQILHASK
jgi:hypothetical protein